MCCSITNIIVNRRPLKDGDIVNIDITVYLDGYHGDTSKTFFVGAVVRHTSFSYLSKLTPTSLLRTNWLRS